MALEGEREPERQAATPPALAEAGPTPAPTGQHAPVQVPGPIPQVAQEPSESSGQATATASEQAYDQRGGPEIDATDPAMGQHMVDAMNKANRGGGLDSGIHYFQNYQSICARAGQPARCKPEHRKGHHFGDAFVNPSESGRFMDFALKPGKSASAAVKEWLRGATIAECLTAVVAMEIDTLRAAIGDTRLDSMFGSADAAVDAKIPSHRRMHIRQGFAGTPVTTYMEATKVANKAASGEKVTDADLEADLVLGQRYYFSNHPMYLLKHPGGAWQGENALYMGKNAAGERLWGGLGANDKTEDAMLDALVNAYNADRGDYDRELLQKRGAIGPDGTYSDKRFDPASGTFPDKITKADLLAAPEYELGGETRKGGFRPMSGLMLDDVKVQRARDGR